MLRRVAAVMLALLLVGGAVSVNLDRSPETAAAGTPGGPARLLLAAPEGSRSLAVRPVDPVTLSDLPGFSPIPFHNSSAHAFTPDGRTLAFIRWSSGEHGRTTMLHFVDVESWEEETVPLALAHDWVGHLFFGADGSALYWIEQITADRGARLTYVLHRYSRTDATTGVLTKLPEGFSPLAVQLLADGRRVAIFGQSLTEEYLAEGDARVLLVGLSDGAIEADIPLPGVLQGQRQTAAGVSEYVLPGLAWDAARSLLYVVDGAPDRVTVVDLSEGRVARQAELRAVSWLERLGLVRVAATKALPGTRLSAALSPGGDRLYVTAFREEVEGPFHSPTAWRGVPLGLTVIDTASLRPVGRLDLPVSDLALTPDGRQLLLWGASWDFAAGSAREGHGVYVVDAARLTQVAHVLPGSDATLLGFSPDGRYAYIGEDTGQGKVRHVVLHLATGRLGAVREVSRGLGFYVQ